MRGTHKNEGLQFSPVRALPDDKPIVRHSLRGGVAGVQVRFKPAGDYDFWRGQKSSKLTTLAMARPAVITSVARGYPQAHVINQIAPIKVGSLEQLEGKNRRQELIEKLKERPC